MDEMKKSVKERVREAIEEIIPEEKELFYNEHFESLNSNYKGFNEAIRLIRRRLRNGKNEEK